MKTDNKRQCKLFLIDKIKRSSVLALIVVFCSVMISAQSESKRQSLYQISGLDSLGNARSQGNSINNRSWVAGYANLSATVRHAALWRRGSITPIDLGTLGASERNSAVTWSVKNNKGLIVGISQTNTPMPLGENWSCSAFIAGTSFTCLGFVWENDVMRPLNPLPGGNNSFATGVNNSGSVVGWAENGIHDPTCTDNNQVLQFLPVVWKARNGQIRTLPTLPGDSSGSATAINDRGQVVGISGDCDQAVGRRTARHAVLWDKDRITDLGNLGADYWNTPTAINQRGDVVGFAGTAGDVDGNILKAFIWMRGKGIQYLKPLESLGHVSSEAYGINERRQVVGISCDAAGVDCRAVIWIKGIAKDLNELKSNDFTPRLEQAKDINERGEITGRSFDAVTNERKAYLAIPDRHDDDGDEDNN